jgi:stage III sporulation protein AD
MDIIKVGILGVAAVLLAIPLRKDKQEYSMFISMAVCICIFIYIITKVEIVLEFIQKLEGLVAIDTAYIGLVIKMVGITYAAEFAVNVCKDAGFGAIAGQIETFAKMSILVVSLPVLLALIDTIGSLM